MLSLRVSADLAQRQAARKGGGAGSSSGAVASTMGRSLMSSDTGKHAADTSFWVPSLTPEARTRVEKPDATVRCPVSGEPLRVREERAVVVVLAVLAHGGICALAQEFASQRNAACARR